MFWSTRLPPPPTRRPNRSRRSGERLRRDRGLQQPTAGYLLMSCKDHDNPPYQGAVYLDFLLRPTSAPTSISVHLGSHGGPRMAGGFRPTSTCSAGICRRTASTRSSIRIATRRVALRVSTAGARLEMSPRGPEWIDVTDRLDGIRKPGLTDSVKPGFARRSHPAWAPSAPCRSPFIAFSCAPQYSQLWVP